MRILTVPRDMAVLRTKSQPVKEIDTELVKFLRDLGKTLKHQKDPAGVGLSAIQVGRPLRVFAIFLPKSKGPTLRTQGRTLTDAKKPRLVFYVNPKIITHPDEMTLGEDLVEDNEKLTTRRAEPLGGANNQRPFLEGCLSIPDIYGPVLRWPWIKATAAVFSEKDLLDISHNGRLDLQLIDISLNGLVGRVFQHELDHLNGILFTDHVLTQGNRLYQDTGNGMEEVNL